MNELNAQCTEYVRQQAEGYPTEWDILSLREEFWRDVIQRAVREIEMVQEEVIDKN